MNILRSSQPAFSGTGRDEAIRFSTELLGTGTLPQGILVDRFGAPAVEAGAGVLCCAIVALLAARSPALRRA